MRTFKKSATVYCAQRENIVITRGEEILKEHLYLDEIELEILIVIIMRNVNYRAQKR